ETDIFHVSVIISYIHAQNRSIDSALNILKKDIHDTTKVKIFNYLAWQYISFNKTKADSFCDLALAIAERNNYLPGISKSYILKGNISFEIADYEKSLEYNLRALKIREKLNDRWGIAGVYGNIGSIYQKLKQWNIAIDYHKKALNHFQDLQKEKKSESNLFSIAECLINIGDIYYQNKQLDSAEKYFSNAHLVYTSIGYLPTVIEAKNKLAALFIMKKNYIKADVYLKESLELSKKINSDKYLCESNLLLAKLYYYTQQYEEAENILKNVLHIADKLKQKEQVADALKLLSNIYYQSGKITEAFQTLRLYLNKKDSILNEKISSAIAEMETKYETEKKNNQIKLLNKEKEKQQLIILFIVVFIVILGLFSVVLYRRFRITSKQKNIIQKQNKELEEQKKELQEKNTEITDSINYAKRIQQSLLPSDDKWFSVFPESFILYKPKDIVAGDFYWMAETEKYVYSAVADCTGHGVPGAMMSVMCINLLNKIILEDKITETSDILTIASQTLAEKLSTHSYRLNDGMDICLIRYNKSMKNEIQYCGANLPLWIVDDTGSIKEYLPNKQPVGYFENSVRFQSYNIAVETIKNNYLYMFSDGFQDQFGGEKGKRLGTKKWKELISEISQINLFQRKKHLENYFDNWKGNNFQVDDVTVVCLTI
ncbi:MAG: tetratricopeptide repeat protein, partial [Candidatus Micrarchaeota archaeon]|nr:tetratricopeptide repeat protein [Candidatus Micrarchaeota archaeon]